MQRLSTRVLLSLLWLAPLAATAAAGSLKRLETRDLRLLYFSPSESFLVPHVARCFENSLAFQRKFFDYRPSEKVTLLLNDFADFGNASAGVIPRDTLIVQIGPLNFAYERMPANENMNWTLNHELVHIAANDQASSGDRFFRGLFQGKVLATAEQPETILYQYLTTPRQAAPRWYQEGLAVFVETWMAGGRGRAQSPYDEMVLRSMVRDGSRFYDPLGLVSEGTKIDFKGEATSYLYGARFMSYLAYTYSPESLQRWVGRAPGSRAYYAAQFKQVYGKPLSQAWKEWIAWEREFQQANLLGIRAYPTTPFVDLARQALGAVSRAYVDEDRHRLYAAFNYPGIVAHVGAISLQDGSVEKIRDVKDPEHYIVTSLAFDPAARTLFYTTDNYAYRDLRSLDPASGKAHTLIKDARIGDLVFDRADRSLWGVRHMGGVTTLVRIPPPYREWRQVHSWPYGEAIFDIDVSPDGRLLSTSHSDASGRSSLRVMKVESLLNGDVTPVASFDFGPALPSNFVFSPDARYLYGSSYYTGVSNIFRFELATSKLDAVSNTETGFFRPLPRGGDSLIVFRYTGEGFVASSIEAKPLEDVSAITFLGERIAEKYPVVREWKVGSPADIPIDSLITREGGYSTLAGVRLESIYPVVQGYKDSASVGVRVNFSDPLLLNRAYLTASYSPDSSLPASERYHVQAEYRRHDWTLGFQRNGADFYDLVGPTKTSLKGWATGIGYDKLLVYDAPRRLDLKADVTYYADLDRVPEYQGIETNFTEELATRVRLRYEDLRHSLGNVDEEKGLSWELGFLGDRVKGDYFPKGYADLDLGLALPIKHSSVWLRSSAGWGPGGDRQEPFANFYFGGFQNNWVDHRSEKRYREPDTFPGFGINEISGTNYARSMVEWSLPPVLFRHAGTPGFYLTWARPAVFATALVTNADDSALRRTVANVGGQVDFRLGVLSRLELTLSAGYAAGFESGAPTRHEGMLSLKILR
jgi:hypothetical protein